MRRFNEEQIAAIFEHAAAAQRVAHDHPSAQAGLTLAELKEIGAETGISAEFLDHAVESMDREVLVEPGQTFLGLPISASHIVDIPGPFTDEDWDRLVVDLRQTFQARGEINRDGSLREWRNGNLYALVEPTASGARLRLGTVKDESKYAIPGGAAWFVFWFLIGLMKSAQQGFEFDPAVLFIGLVALVGLTVAVATAVRLPAWSNERRRQMEAIAGRVLKTKVIQAGEVQNRVESHVETPDDGCSILWKTPNQSERACRGRTESGGSAVCYDIVLKRASLTIQLSAAFVVSHESLLVY